MAHPTLLDPGLDWNALNRYLLIGHALGVYETPVPDLRQAPSPVLDRCLREDGVRVVRLAAHLLISGRPHRPEPALYALSRAITTGDTRTRDEAIGFLAIAVRTGHQWFQLLDYLSASAWPDDLRAALGQWYTHCTAVELVQRVIRSPQAGSWTHARALALVHAQPPTPAHAEVFRWILQRMPSGAVLDDPGLELLSAYQLLRTTNAEAVVSTLLRRWPTLHEDVPDAWLKYPSVWRQIVPTLSTDALVRWLPRLTAAKLLHAEDRLHEAIWQRLQLGGLGVSPTAPVAALRAIGALRHAAQAPAHEPPGALERALWGLFHDRVRATTPSLDTLVIAIDPAASTASDGIADLPGVAPRVAFAALTLMAAAKARTAHVLAFGKSLVPIALDADERIDTLLARLDAVAPGATDGASPIDWAVRHSVRADAFLVLSGTRPHRHAGQPEEAFGRYRDMVGKRATWLAVSHGPHRLCQDAPSDLNMMEARGLDSHVPALVLELLGDTP